MFRFRWQDLVTDDLMAEVLQKFPNTNHDDRQYLRRVLVRLISRVGGPPLTTRKLNRDECGRLARFLLAQPMLHLVTRRHDTIAPTPFKATAGLGPLGRVVRRIELVDMNLATASTLALDAGLTPQLSKAVVHERKANGPFNSLAELIARVDGLSATQKRQLRRVGSFRRSDTLSTWSAPPSLAETFADVVAMIDKGSTAAHVTRRSTVSGPIARRRVRSGISRATAALATIPIQPVPWAEHLMSAGLNNGRADWNAVPVEFVGFLPDREYYEAVRHLVDEADRAICLCMFHVVFSSPQHPTRKLLESLVAAMQRGVSVRVLMDRDRKTDPYRSTIINKPAYDFFKRNGIACRLDDSDRLLHSKYLIIDKSLVVVGSHNWSAGSYFAYEDLSFAVHSGAFARIMGNRFERQWARAIRER